MTQFKETISEGKPPLRWILIIVRRYRDYQS